MPRCGNHLRAHEVQVCDSCVGQVRADLLRIVQLCGFLPAVAATNGITSETASLAGPVPEHSTHSARHWWALSGGLCRCRGLCPDRQAMPEGPECSAWKICDHVVCRRRTGRPTCPDLAEWLDTADDELHPLWVLGYWDGTVATHLSHSRTLKVTVDTSAGYIGANLTDLARSEGFPFDQMSFEISACATHLEHALLLAAYKATGAPCPVCHTQGRKAKPLVLVYDEDDWSGDSDRWICPTCDQEWTLDEYDRYVAREAVLHKPCLTASEIATVYRVPESTVRRWASAGKVRRRGWDGSRRQLYDVADVKACRQTTEAYS